MTNEKETVYPLEEALKIMADEKETAEILKKSLTIVDKLATIEIDDVAMNGADEYDKLEELIKKAKELKKSRLWKLR
jgi:hypothetical protein